MRATTTPPVFSSGWRHFSLTYAQPYTILCKGAGFEVKQASNYDFNRDFSVAMTFSASDVTAEQGLLYKGTGSDVTPPELSMSYRIAISGGERDGRHSRIRPVECSRPSWGRRLRRATGISSSSSNTRTRWPEPPTEAIPYGPPLDIGELTPAASGGASANLRQFQLRVRATSQFKNMQGTGNTPKLNDLLQKIGADAPKQYTLTIAVRTVNDDGTFGSWNPDSLRIRSSGDEGLSLNSTGHGPPAHRRRVRAGRDSLASRQCDSGVGNIRDVYLFNGAIDRAGHQDRLAESSISPSASPDELISKPASSATGKRSTIRTASSTIRTTRTRWQFLPTRRRRAWPH